MNKKTVSICTPTYNRREFMKKLIDYVNHQDYPKKLIQWVIVDDGEDKIEDLIKDMTNVVYVKLPKKVPLGKKRNIMHDHATGSIIVYMDDDDYYPSTRVSHAVDELSKNPNILCAGCSKIYVYFEDSNKIYSFGPYNNYHATANTFAFKRELLEQTKYEDTATRSEEKYFLKNFTIPMIQLNTIKTILTISHHHNTYDKRQIMQHAKESNKSIFHFINSGFIISNNYISE